MNGDTLVGRKIKLIEPYQGGDGNSYTEGTIAEELEHCRFGVHLNGYEYGGSPITVDFHRADFQLLPGNRRFAPVGYRGLPDE